MPAPIDLTDLPTPVKAKLTPVKVPLPGGPEVVFEVSTSAEALERDGAIGPVMAASRLSEMVTSKDRKKWDEWLVDAKRDLDGDYFAEVHLSILKAVLGKDQRKSSD